MADLAANWWAWMLAGVVLAMVETLAPGFFFLGFAIGAGLTGLLLAFGFSPGLPVLLLIFALLSVLAWIVTRRLAGKRPGQVRIWDRDINDNPP